MNTGFKSEGDPGLMFVRCRDLVTRVLRVSYLVRTTYSLAPGALTGYWYSGPTTRLDLIGQLFPYIQKQHIFSYLDSTQRVDRLGLCGHIRTALAFPS